MASSVRANPEGDPDPKERRRQLHKVIIRNPGIHFREALRSAHVPAGSGRHHVHRLAKAGLIIIRRNGPHMYLFENHGKYDDGWQLLAAARDENSRRLVDWINGRPDSAQKHILDAFQNDHGWNRSTTQKRLDKLEQAAILTTRARGRYKLYRLTDALPTQPVPEESVTA